MNGPVEIFGVEMSQGGSVTVTSTDLFRNWLMPVLVAEDGELKVNGTAVCIGHGTFVTTRHVVDYILDGKAEDEDADVWVAWDAGDVLSNATEFRGHMMPVLRYRWHEEVDLAILTTKVLESRARELFAEVRFHPAVAPQR